MNIFFKLTARNVVKKIARQLGVDIIQFTPIASNFARLKHFLAYYQFSLVLDVGANTGQYANMLRELCYEGRIVSFEPVTSAYSLLKLKSDKDANWEVASQCAVGDQNAEIEINVSENTQCSSLLQLTDELVSSFPKSAYFKTENIPLRKLDTIAKQYFKGNEKVLLKIDTQGFEKKVIEGAKNILPNILGLQIELSLTPLYKEEMLYDEMIQYLKRLGYELYALIPGFTDSQTGKMMQMDGLFLKMK
jgi:FkbM family methyltransferase